MKTARKLTDAFGSALTFMGLIREITKTVFHPLMNERGEVGDSGDDPTNPGDDALEMDAPENTDGGDDKPPAPSDGDTPAEADAGTDQTPEPADKTPENPPAEPQQSVDELNQRIAQMEADLQQANDMAQFYSQFYQQAQGQQPVLGQQTGQQAQDQPPEGVINPGDWEDQEHTANWVNHTINERLQQGYQQMIAPMMQQLSSAIQGLQMATARGGKDDWDDVYSDAMKEIFTMAPDGKVIGVKNEALLNYFRAQQNPFEAIYQYGLTKRAPETIKKQVQANTKKAFESIGKRPKGPTQPKGGGKDGKPEAELDWDTPPEQAEKVLAKKGLI